MDCDPHRSTHERIEGRRYNDVNPKRQLRRRLVMAIETDSGSRRGTRQDPAIGDRFGGTEEVVRRRRAEVHSANTAHEFSILSGAGQVNLAPQSSEHFKCDPLLHFSAP